MRYGNAVRVISADQTGANLSENSTIVIADYANGKFNSSRSWPPSVQGRGSDVSLASEKDMFDPISIGESDVQLASNASQIYGLWVNGTSLASFNTVHSSPALQTLPESSFPYVRLAGINPSQGSVYYLYNQIGPDTIVENQLDISADQWTPSKINITDI